MIRSETHPLLFTPGPLNIPQKVREALCFEMGSRTEQFRTLHRNVIQKLIALAKYEGECALLGSSATEAIEKALVNFIHPQERVLVIENGFYGKRLNRIIETLGLDHQVLSGECFSSISEDQIERTIKNQSFSWVVMVHCETSTGVINPLAQWADLFKKNRLKIFVDAVSSFPVVPLDWSYGDVVVTTSGKCLQGPPGISILFFKEALLKPQRVPTIPWAYDLYDQMNSLKTTGEWRFTPPIPLILGLNAALDYLNELGGPPCRLAHYQHLEQLTLKSFEALGLVLVRPPGTNLLPGLLNFEEPLEGCWSKVLEKLALRNIFLYKGLLESQRTFRVCLWGDLTESHVQELIDSLQVALQKSP